jgi:HD-like signal output (HDOD) protein
MRAALAQAEPDLTEVARIAASDVAMSATLIKLANSPAFSLGQPVHTVGQAMTRLGLQKTAQEMTAYLVRTTLKVNSPQLQRFWERSTKRAVAMGHIAHHLPGLSVDLAHTYGLFAHVGMPVMMQSLRGYAGTMVEAAARIDRSYIATENANHRTDHAVVGALVARVWQLAPEVMVAIRRHHDLDMLGDAETEPEAHTLVAAGLVAEHLMRRHEGLPPDADWAGTNRGPGLAAPHAGRPGPVGRRAAAAAGRLLRPAPDGIASAVVRQLDLHLEHFQVVLALELDLQVVRVDLHVLGDHGHQLALQRGQVVGRGGAAAAALVGQDDLQPLLGDGGGGLLLAEQEGEEGHGHHLPKMRLKKPGLTASVKRMGLSSPRKRATTSW